MRGFALHQTVLLGELRLTEGTSDVSQGAEIGSLMFLNPSNDNKNAKIAALRTTGTSGADLAFYTRTHGDATNNEGGIERLRIDSGGRLLLGHTSSQDVYTTSKLQIQGTTAATSSLSLLRHGNSPYLTLGSSGGSSLGAVNALSSGDRIGQISFAGADGTDINTHAASISAYVDGTVSSNNVPAHIRFATGPSEKERVRIQRIKCLRVDASF